MIGAASPRYLIAEGTAGAGLRGRAPTRPGASPGRVRGGLRARVGRTRPARAAPLSSRRGSVWAGRADPGRPEGRVSGLTRKEGAPPSLPSPPLPFLPLPALCSLPLCSSSRSFQGGCWCRAKLPKAEELHQVDVWARKEGGGPFPGLRAIPQIRLSAWARSRCGVLEPGRARRDAEAEEASAATAPRDRAPPSPFKCVLGNKHPFWWEREENWIVIGEHVMRWGSR